MKEKDLQDALLEVGRRRGLLTFEEFNEAFPADYCKLAEMEKFLRRLRHLGVRVVEGNGRDRAKTRGSHAA